MNKTQNYLNISAIWYETAKRYNELAELESNHSAKREWRRKAELAAKKGEQFEIKARKQLQEAAF